MNVSTLAIPVGFILYAVLLCWWFIRTEVVWWKKLPVVIVMPAFGLIVWHSMGSYLGWPTPEEPPDKALVLAAAVREPEPSANEKGAVYLWLRSLAEKEEDGLVFLDYANPIGEPRAYKLPYSREMHEAVEKANGMIREGRPVVIDKNARRGRGGQGEPGEGEPGDEEGVDGGEEGQGGGRKGYRYDQNRRDYQVYELPPPHPPEKRRE